MIIKSDQEPSILELIQAVKRERSEDIEEMATEQSPVGEHQSNGQVERAIQSIQGQIRTMLLSLESRYKMKLKEDHPIMAWLVRHAAMLINIIKVGQDGRTAYERRKGRKFNRPLPEIGECIMYLNPKSIGVDKLDPRSEQGIFAGLREESGEIYVMNSKGVIKVRSFSQRVEEERWNQEEFNQAEGTPWEPIPGRAGVEIKARFQFKDLAAEPVIKAPVTRESTTRSLHIAKDNLKKYNLSPGCRGCIAANRGTTAIQHN